MTIALNDRIVHVVAGVLHQAAFDFDYRLDALDGLAVYLTPAATGVRQALLLTTHYTIAGLGSPTGGTVTLVPGVAAGVLVGDLVTIAGDHLVARVTDYVTRGDFTAANINADLDALIELIQERKRDAARALRLRVDDDGTLDELPLKAARASKMLSFDALGMPVATIATADVVAVTGALVQIAADLAATLAAKVAAQAAAAAALVSQTAAGVSAASAAAAIVTTAANAAAALADRLLADADKIATAADRVVTTADKASAIASAGSAATDAGTAAAAAVAAASSFDNFDDRYLGAKAADPALDNDGNALLVGAMYFNTVGNVVKMWSGAAWVTAFSPGGGVASFNSRTGAVLPVAGDYTKADVGLGNVDNTSDVNKPVSTAQAIAIAAIIASADAMVFKGVIDASANPNYPAADRGHTYRISVAGKIGGAAGVNVEIGDLILCLTDGTAAGNQATVGTAWTIAQSNIDGAVIGPAAVTGGNPAVFNGATGKLLQEVTFAAFKTSLVLVKADVGLANVDNTSDATKPVSAAQAAAILLATAVPMSSPQGRLTLTSGVPVTTADVSGATTLYYTPASGNYVPCIVGAVLGMRTFAELSQTAADATKSPAAVAASKIYDILIWDDAGTVRATRSAAWASDTSRGVGAGTAERVFANGYWTNAVAVTNGPAAGKGIVVGSVRSNAASQFVDSEAFRWVSNIYNSVPRTMRVIEPTDTWSYATAAWRQARATAANQLDFLQALAGGMLSAEVSGAFSNAVTANCFGVVAIGIDSTTTPSNLFSSLNYQQVLSQPTASVATYFGYPGEGRHFAAWLEQGPGTGTQTWYGDGGGTLFQAGIGGWINN